MTTTAQPTLSWVHPLSAPTVHHDTTRGAGKCLAVSTSNGWVGLFPKPENYNSDRASNTADYGWNIGNRMSLSEIERLGLSPYLDSHLGWYIGTPTDVRPFTDDDAVARLIRERDAAVAALATFKQQVVEVGGQAAEDNDWCSVFEEVMDELGLPGRNQVFRIRVNVCFEQEVSVRSYSENAARNLVGDLSVNSGWEPGSPLDDYDTDHEFSAPTNVTFTVA